MEAILLDFLQALQTKVPYYPSTTPYNPGKLLVKQSSEVLLSLLSNCFSQCECPKAKAPRSAQQICPKNTQKYVVLE